LCSLLRSGTVSALQHGTNAWGCNAASSTANTTNGHLLALLAKEALTGLLDWCQCACGHALDAATSCQSACGNAGADWACQSRKGQSPGDVASQARKVHALLWSTTTPVFLEVALGLSVDRLNTLTLRLSKRLKS
jgi:hypothetical protein